MIIQSLAHENKPYHRACLTPVEDELEKRGHTVLRGGRKPFPKDKIEATMVTMAFYLTKENARHLKRPIFFFPHGVAVVKVTIEDRLLNSDFMMQTGPVWKEEMINLFPQFTNNLEIGFPKSDELFNGKSTRDEVVKELGLDPKEPIIVFAPTYYQKGITHAGSTPVLSEIQKLGLKNLIVCLHEYDEQFNSLEGKKIIKAPNKNRYLLAADLLIGDYSSILIEFAILDKPIIQIDVTGNLEQFGLWGRQVEETGPFKIGEVVEPKNLEKAIEDALSNKDKYKALRQ